MQENASSSGLQAFFNIREAIWKEMLVSCSWEFTVSVNLSVHKKTPFKDMFNTINQFSDLFKSRMEALLAEDALTEDSKKFNAAVKQLTEKDYDYLDFRNLSFDRDYNDFLSRMDDLTSRLQVFKILTNQKSGFITTGPIIGQAGDHL